MDKQQFLQRFSYHHLGDIESGYQHTGNLKHASVLIPLVQTKLGIEVILTKRAKHLKHHPGQISFPGGKVEARDINLTDTALREAEEEIGLYRKDVDIVGQLNDYHTITGFRITPIIGFIPQNYPFKIDQNEVEEIFSVPFPHFTNEKNHLNYQLKRQGVEHNIYFMPYLNYNIWGATAAILKDLVGHLK
ncbi:CoA pyrophosphatase [Thalassotalea nanhaiensis]|uniref:CoA pyrophosphatase n=1 Tax=Thalassotalea nanhaiensis TaxID=3065648 RepID=A0ABY9TMQ2_9GAMM|nr:CoA pyrophosphatase [Colwelliaceae bacterium SQ345]